MESTPETRPQPINADTGESPSLKTRADSKADKKAAKQGATKAEGKTVDAAPKSKRVKAKSAKNAPPSSPSEEPKAATTDKIQGKKPVVVDKPVATASKNATADEAKRMGPLLAKENKVAAALDISSLIVKKDLEKALDAKKGFLELPLTGQVPGPDYNHIRLVPRGAGPVLGLTVQVWKDSTIANARRKYRSFLKSYPGASENKSITSRTFFARYAKNLYAGYFALRERTIVVLTCDQTVCNAETLHKAGLATKRRLPAFSSK